MTNKAIRHSVNILSGVLLVVLSSFSEAPQVANTSISIIVNKDNPVASMTAQEVKQYWLKKYKTQWTAIEKNIRPADRKTKCAEREIFYWKVLNMTTDEVETYFLMKQYQNATKPQEKFNSEKEIIDFVGDDAGAIGYVNTNSLTPEAKAKVKVVLTITD